MITRTRRTSPLHLRRSGRTGASRARPITTEGCGLLRRVAGARTPATLRDHEIQLRLEAARPSRGRLGLLEAAMPGMKVTVDSAMRARDVSRPGQAEMERAAAGGPAPRPAGPAAARRPAAQASSATPRSPADKAQRSPADKAQRSPADKAQRSPADRAQRSPADSAGSSSGAPASAAKTPARPAPSSLPGPGTRRRGRRRPRR